MYGKWGRGCDRVPEYAASAGLRLLTKLAGAADFLANDAAQGGFEKFPCVGDVLTEGIVDQALVVAAAGLFHLRTKPGHDVFVETNGEPGFTLRDRDDRAAPAF